MPLVVKKGRGVPRRDAFKQNMRVPATFTLPRAQRRSLVGGEIVLIAAFAALEQAEAIASSGTVLHFLLSCK